MKLTRELNHAHERAKGASTLAQVCKPAPGRLTGKDCWESEAGLRAKRAPGQAGLCTKAVSKAKQTNK